MQSYFRHYYFIIQPVKELLPILTAFGLGVDGNQELNLIKTPTVLPEK